MQTNKYYNTFGKLLLISALLGFRPVAALELIMIEQAGCHHCERFNTEIAPAYPKTAEGQRAPLRRVDLHGEWPTDLSNISKEPFTPVFVLVHENQELGRLRGYPGDEHFWFLLNQMLESATTDAK